MAGASKGKVAIKDVVTPGAENDPEYQKVVKEIQEGNTRSGWLVGRGGAFDKTVRYKIGFRLEGDDLAYLSDFKDAEAAKELDMRWSEASEFAKLRSRLESAGSDGLPAGAVAAGLSGANGSGSLLVSAGSGGLAGAATVRVAVKEKQGLRQAAKLLPAIKVVSPRDGLARALRGSQELEDGVPVMKRARTGSTELPDRDTVPAPAGLSENVTAAGRSTESGVGLQGLLGTYGSSGESEEEEDSKGKAAGARVGALPVVSALPSAAELFEDEQVQVGTTDGKKQAEIKQKVLSSEDDGSSDNDE